MSRRWVVNASPLIVLGTLDRIELLRDLPETLVIPSQVAEEIHKGPPGDAARNWLSEGGKKHIAEAPRPPQVIASRDLGAGESHVLSFAMANQGYEVVLDDLASRKCAGTLSIPTLGTLGVLLLAKKRGLINAISPVVDQLLQEGFYVDSQLADTIRRLADE